MPNITGGGFYLGANNATSSWGAVVENRWENSKFLTNTSAEHLWGQIWTVDASRCSTVYSDSATTVTPESLAVGFYIKF